MFKLFVRLCVNLIHVFFSCISKIGKVTFNTELHKFFVGLVFSAYFSLKAGLVQEYSHYSTLFPITVLCHNWLIL